MSQKAKASSKSKDSSKYSEAAEDIIVPKLVFTPSSNHHKWKKQVLKQLKRNFGPIHDAVVSKCYPDFQEESMQIICTPPEKVFKELSKTVKSKQRARKSIASRGRISIFSSRFDDESSDASESNYSSSDESSAYVTDRRKKVSISDPLSKISPSVEAMLKMSTADDDEEDSPSLKASSSEKSKERSKSPVKKLSDQQIQLVNNYLIGKQKQILDMETYFEKNLPSAVAEVVSTFSPTAETKISQHRKYDKAYEENDIILLFKIIDQCAVLTPLDIPSLASEIRDKRRKLFQGGKSMDYYCELYNRYEKDLKEINRPTPEEDLITEFINHLNPSYCGIIAQWKHLDMIPKTLDQMQYKLRQYEAVAIAQASAMKPHGTSKLSSDGAQDVAMAAMTKSHSQKGGKGSSSKDKKPQSKLSGGKQERKKLTEDEAKALGLKKLPCCGKYGTHKPEDCRSSKINATQVNSAESQPKTKKDEVATVAAKGVSFYDNDDEFNLVLLYKSRQSDPISVESESVTRPAVVSAEPTPEVEASTPIMANSDEVYSIAPGTHVSEHTLGHLMRLWDSFDTAEAQHSTPSNAPAVNNDDADLPDLVPADSDDSSSDNEEPHLTSCRGESDDVKKHNPRSKYYVRPQRNHPERHAERRPTRSDSSAMQRHRTHPREEPSCFADVTHILPVVPATPSDDIVLYLDTGASSNAVPSSSPIIHDVHDIPTREIIGVGQEDCTQAGILEHFGPALLVPSLSIHIISASVQVKRGYDLTFDNARNRFCLSREGREYIFTHRPNGLYGYSYIRPAAHVHIRLDKLINGRYYTAEQQRRAAAGQAFHCSTGHANFQYLRFALTNGTFLNCPVTPEDLTLAEEIYGRCPGCDQGKMTQSAHSPSKEARSNVIGERVYVDLAFVDKAPLLVSIDEASNCILAYDLKGSKSSARLQQVLGKLEAAYLSYGHRIQNIYSDSEANLLSTEVYLNGRGILLRHSLPGRHCALVERAIRTIKDRARATLFSLPYILPPICRIPLFLDAASCCNLVPTDATGARSPREIFTGVKIDASLHLRSKYGDYILVKTPWTSTKPKDHEPRSEAGLMVGRDFNSKGGIKVFLLGSNQIVPRDTFSIAVLTAAVIAQINSFSAQQPISDDLFPDAAQPADSTVPPSQAISKTTLPLPGVLSSADHVTSDTDDGHLPQPSDTSQSDAEPSVDRGERQSRAGRKTNWKTRVFNLTAQKAKEMYGAQKATDSMLAEITQQVQMDVWEVCKKQHLSLDAVKRIIPCSLFLKEKLLPDGSFDKLKARLVAGGHRQDTSLYDDVSSPTVNLTTLYTILAIAAHEGHNLTAIDIKGAYLNASLKTVEVHMRIPPYLARLFVPVYMQLQNRDISDYLEKDGSLIVKIKKALYGLVESARLWYDHLCATLLSIGYKVSQFDRGLFFKDTDTGKSLICLHVDDVLQSTNSNALNEELIKHLRTTYKDINIQTGDKIFYLGLQLDVNSRQRSIEISQPGYVADLLKEFPVDKVSVSPAADNLFDTSSEGQPVDTTAYASKLMKLSYLAKRTRPDILLAVSFLAMRMKNPNHYDSSKLQRIYEYLAKTQDYTFTLKPSSFRILAWVDASYAVHTDGRSHTGILIGFGGHRGLVYFRSSVQRLVSDSSTYAELIAQHDGAHTIQWLSFLMQELGYSVSGDQVPIMYQDNRSAIQLAERGPGVVSRSRHFQVRYFYVKELVDNNSIKLAHVPTEQMHADFMTKPNQGKLFRVRVYFLLGYD
eukprot:gene34190-44172_t